jgi:hypothetical protein
MSEARVILHICTQYVCVPACVQLRPPLVQQTPAKGDGVKPGGYPFADRDMNSCIGLRGCVTA